MIFNHNEDNDIKNSPLYQSCIEIQSVSAVPSHTSARTASGAAEKPAASDTT